MNRSVLAEERLRQGLAGFAVLQLLTGVWLVVSPDTFYDAVANFGARDDHLMRDIATYDIAMGIALAMAITRRSWRVPVLFMTTIQFALHALNHLVDIGKSDPGWIGPFDFVAIAGLTALLGYMLHSAAKGQH